MDGISVKVIWMRKDDIQHGYRHIAYSDEVARAFRDDVARDYEMMSPGFGASLACLFFALGKCRSSVPDNV